MALKVSRGDFDAEEWRMADDALTREAGGEDADVGDADADGRDTDAGFDDHADAPVFLVCAQDSVDL